LPTSDPDPQSRRAQHDPRQTTAWNEQAADAGRAHQPLNALAAEPLAVGENQLGMDARRPIDARNC
jgi:hypothetical protein